MMGCVVHEHERFKYVWCVLRFANIAKEMPEIRTLFPALFQRVLPRADFFEARERERDT